ncbi:MAG: hypothetical protein ACRD9Q_00195 [Nitrososphaeraceae archaeon]
MNRHKKSSNYRNIVVFVIVAIIFVIPSLQQSLFASHGKEIVLKFNDAQFFLRPGKNTQQVKFTATYSISDFDIVGKQISGTMKIYTHNGALIKTTSIPNGFSADKSGFQQFVTSFPDSSVQSITTVVLLTDLNKTSPLSNSVTENLVLNNTK